MNENIIKELKEHIDYKFENHVPKYFKDFTEKLEDEIGSLAVSTANQFLKLEKEITDLREDIGYEIGCIRNEMVTKEEIKPILQLIGSYEIRAKNVEDILLNDHKPKIADLEKEVFANS